MGIRMQGRNADKVFLWRFTGVRGHRWTSLPERLPFHVDLWVRHSSHPAGEGEEAEPLGTLRHARWGSGVVPGLEFYLPTRARQRPERSEGRRSENLPRICGEGFPPRTFRCAGRDDAAEARTDGREALYRNPSGARDRLPAIRLVSKIELIQGDRVRVRFGDTAVRSGAKLLSAVALACIGAWFCVGACRWIRSRRQQVPMRAVDH